MLLVKLAESSPGLDDWLPPWGVYETHCSTALARLDNLLRLPAPIILVGVQQCASLCL